MNKVKYYIAFVTILLSCLLSGFISGVVLVPLYASQQYHILSGLVQDMVKQYPGSEQNIMKLLKENIVGKGNILKPNNSKRQESILGDYGYSPHTFMELYQGKVIFVAILTTILFVTLIGILYCQLKKKKERRIADLTAYLMDINEDKDRNNLNHKEDEFSLLEDEIYKTVTQLRYTREIARKEKEVLGDNIADISHQIKTPVTTITLMTQLIKDEKNQNYIKRIQSQTTHLENLVGALLTLSRIDAGVLKLEKKAVNTYTMLQLSLDALNGMLLKKRIQVDLPNHPELFFFGDLEWSMEACINIIKNCVEHTKDEGLISIEYEQNPLYLEIRIEDYGNGFLEKDLPHIFERFYRGENGAEGGTGIGLSLAKALIELQNGNICAINRQDGGACFILHFYCH